MEPQPSGEGPWGPACSAPRAPGEAAWPPMASPAALEPLQEEASCPVCLDFLQDAVTIECGHSFCRACLLGRWQGLQDIWPCPVCLHHCRDWSPRSNPQLSRVVQAIQRLPALGRDPRPRCEQHGEALLWVCEEDLALLCVGCRARDGDHQDHRLSPIPQVAAEYRRELKGQAEILMGQIRDAQAGLERQRSTHMSLMEDMANSKKELAHEVEDLKHFLEMEKVEVDKRLLQNRWCVLSNLMANKSRISDQIKDLKDLDVQIREKCLQGDLAFLRSVGSIQARCKALKPPALASQALPRESCLLPPHYFGLHKMIRTFQVDLTLNPEAAHPVLLVSPDRKSVEFTRKESLPDFFAAVQSEQRLTSGRHFWQVEVRGEGEWAVGVCQESSYRNMLWRRGLPSQDCWQIEQSTTHAWAGPRVRRTGVFLDYELGEVSFYNVSKSSRSFTLTGKFREALVPFFSIYTCSQALQISLIREE